MIHGECRYRVGMVLMRAILVGTGVLVPGMILVVMTVAYVCKLRMCDAGTYQHADEY